MAWSHIVSNLHHLFILSKEGLCLYEFVFPRQKDLDKEDKEKVDGQLLGAMLFSLGKLIKTSFGVDDVVESIKLNSAQVIFNYGKEIMAILLVHDRENYNLYKALTQEFIEKVEERFLKDILKIYTDMIGINQMNSIIAEVFSIQQ